MAWIKYYPFVVSISAALSLEIFINPGFSIQRQAQYSQPILNQSISSDRLLAQAFKPPNRGAPSSTLGAGSRGGSCIASSQKPLTALLPESKLGLTVSEYPTFFGYIPQSSAKTGEFILQDKNNRLVARKSFSLPSQPGIVSISLPAAGLRALEVGKMYKWRLRIICNSDDRSQDTQSDIGWIERIQPSQTLDRQLKNGTARNLPALYADAGIWHDALANLVKLRRTQPNDATLASDWEKMLSSESVGLEKFIQEPLVDCCQVEN